MEKKSESVSDPNGVFLFIYMKACLCNYLEWPWLKKQWEAIITFSFSLGDETVKQNEWKHGENKKSAKTTFLSEERTSQVGGLGG